MSDIGYVLSRVSALIVSLLGRRRPSAIGWFVVPVWIDAVYGCVVERTRPHVCQEGGAGVKPSVAYADAPRAIQMVVIVPGIVAALFHVLPHDPFLGYVAATGTTVFVVGGSYALTLEASATHNASTAQVGAAHDVRSAAVATTDPSRFVPAVWTTRGDRQATESASGEIDQFRHTAMITKHGGHWVEYCQI